MNVQLIHAMQECVLNNHQHLVPHVLVMVFSVMVLKHVMELEHVLVLEILVL